jgi:hypothetical protein
LEQEIPPREKRKRKGPVIIAIVAMSVMVAAFAIYWFTMRLFAIPWLFKGAYATYEGETFVLFITVKFNMRIEVVDYNFTHAKLLIYTKVTTPLGSQEFQNISWVDLAKKSYEIKGAKLKRTYEQEIYVEGFGTRNCIIYEYESTNGGSTIFYIDKSIGWPIKMTFFMKVSEYMPGMSIDLKITESNIPGLKK